MTLPPKLAAIWRATQSLLQRIDKGSFGPNAASVAFFGFLALFPALAAVIALWGFFSDAGMIRQEIALLGDVLPEDAFLLLSEQVEGLLVANNGKLGLTSVISVLFALWSARAGVSALISGINDLHHLPDRGTAHHTFASLLLTLVLVAIALAGIIASVVAPLLIGLLPLGAGTALGLEAANVILGFLLVVLGLALIYRYGPNYPARLRPPFFTPGVLVAVILWALASRGLVIYLENFNNYNKIYGSIGAVVALMLWFYLSAYAVLLGAAIDAERR